MKLESWVKLERWVNNSLKKCSSAGDKVSNGIDPVNYFARVFN